jgi:uncharacterized RDD family membrane protein YckC
MEELIDQQSSEFDQASLTDRLLGGIIDWLVVMGLSYILQAIVGWRVGYLAAAAYILLRDALPFLDGQSVGKKVMKTRSVYQDSGAPITNDYKTSFLRSILLSIPFLGLIDALFIFSGDHKRLGDRIAKTLVIYDK